MSDTATSLLAEWDQNKAEIRDKMLADGEQFANLVMLYEYLRGAEGWALRHVSDGMLSAVKQAAENYLSELILSVKQARDDGAGCNGK